MLLSEPVREIRRLAAASRIGAIVMAEQAVDTHVAAFMRPDDRTIALDILLRDLARLRTREPMLDGFIGEVEGYIDLLHRELAPLRRVMRGPAILCTVIPLAAALPAAGPALALDFEKAAAAPSLEPCPGKPGFVRVPGGDACVRVSGRVAAGADVRAGRDGTAAVPTASGRFAIDNRVDTDLGEVRTYVRVGGGRR